MKNNIHKCSILACLRMIILCIVSPSLLSEVTLDGSMGTAGSVNGPNYQITQELGQRTGNNLFHSFGQFNLSHTESATFSGSTGIENIIGRITGGDISSIDGLLRVTIPEANLYLFNPAGIMFGQHAKLDVPGSFHASTADYLQFQDGVQFESGVITANRLLTTTEPESFGFLGDTPAGISLTGGNHTVLEVPRGEMISLVGGDITIKDASLYAPGGQINLASVGSVGNVVITETGLDTTSIKQGRQIDISQDSLIPLSPIVSEGVAANIQVSDDIAGRVYIVGEQLVMENASILSETKNGHGGNILLDVGELKLTQGARIASSTSASGNGGDLIVNAHTIILEGDDSNTIPIFFTGTNNNGDAGNITITANELAVSHGAFIQSFTFAEGDTGNLTINANSLDMYNSAIIGNSTSGKGDTGNLSIISNNLNVREGAQILVMTSESGNNGDLHIKADTILLSGASKVSSGIKTLTFKSGGTGNLWVNSNKLEIRDGAEILALTTNSGDTGDIVIESSEIILTGTTNIILPSSTNSRVSSQIASRISDINENGSATGNSGNLTVLSNDLLVSNGALITTTNLGQGNSGRLFVDSSNILLTNDLDKQIFPGGIQAELGSTGNSGDLLVKSQNLMVQNGASISASNFGSGKGGDLIVEVEKSILLDGKSLPIGSDNSADVKPLYSGITNEAFSIGTVGNSIITTKNLQIQNGAKISASTLGFANAGDLKIDVEHLEMHNGSVIGATTLGIGKSGDLKITANDILLDNGALLHSGIIRDEFDIPRLPDVNRSGNIVITFNDTFRIRNKSAITTVSTQPNAGKITIENGSSLQLSDSDIITSVASGSGKGGDIRIDTPIVVLDNSRIGATADEGRGGNINISGFLFQSPSSIISATSQKGVDGQVDLIPDTNISGSIGVLPGAFINTSEQLSERCSARSGSNLSSFVIKGRSGMPVEPGKLTPSDFLDYPSIDGTWLQTPAGENLPEYPTLVLGRKLQKPCHAGSSAIYLN